MAFCTGAMMVLLGGVKGDAMIEVCSLAGLPGVEYELVSLYCCPLAGDIYEYEYKLYKDNDDPIPA